MCRRGMKWFIYYVVEDKCIGCKICINVYGCFVIYWDLEIKKVKVDLMMCWGCGGCV